MKNQTICGVQCMRPAGLALLAVLLIGGSRADATTIQAEINAASPGQTVTVPAGIYHEDIQLKSGVNVIGAGWSTTIIQGTGTNYVVTAIGVTNARLAGFTITGATSTSGGYVGGLYLQSSSIVVENNLIISNQLGATITYGSPIIRDNIFMGNGCASCDFYTVTLWCNSASPLIANNLVASNFCGGLYVNGTGNMPQVINNTIADNLGVGVDCEYAVLPVIKNNIITANQTGVTAIGTGTAPAMSYNDVWNNFPADYAPSDGGVVGPGTGDISTDPLFDPASLVLFALATGSPCLHAGDPDPMYDNPDGSRNTMGAYGGPGAMTPLVTGGLTSGFVFTTVGLVPTAVITNSGPLAGLANVPPSVAVALYIPAWEDAPFGGQPYLYGEFGSSDTKVAYYQILGAPWSGGNPPASTNFQPILDPLSKYKYVILPNGSVQTSLVNVGPDANGLYSRTDLPNSGYWSSPDLKLVLNTYHLQNGQWDFICVGYSNDTMSAVVSLPTNQLSRLTLWVDNNPVTVNIASVRNQDGSVVPECGIISVFTNEQNLEFEITAYQPSGFLDSYSLASYYGANRAGGTIASDHYAGVHDGSRPYWSGIGPGTLITNSQPAQLSGALLPWQTCAYQFELSATARTINGFNEIYYADFNDHFYITVGSSLPGCAADLDGDGRVDGMDLLLFAQRYGVTNCATSGSGH